MSDQDHSRGKRFTISRKYRCENSHTGYQWLTRVVDSPSDLLSLQDFGWTTRWDPCTDTYQSHWEQPGTANITVTKKDHDDTATWEPIFVRESRRTNIRYPVILTRYKSTMKTGDVRVSYLTEYEIAVKAVSDFLKQEKRPSGRMDATTRMTIEDVKQEMKNAVDLRGRIRDFLSSTLLTLSGGSRTSSRH